MNPHAKIVPAVAHALINDPARRAEILAHLPPAVAAALRKVKAQGFRDSGGLVTAPGRHLIDELNAEVYRLWDFEDQPWVATHSEAYFADVRAAISEALARRGQRIEPSLLKQALDLGRSALKEMRAIAGHDAPVDEAEKSRRLAICYACPRLMGDAQSRTPRCAECGCFVKIKAGMRSAACPLGKW